MNGGCDTKVKQILEAIEYGTLPPVETEGRLFSIIENEINKEDEAADLGLISVAQDLLLELHNRADELDEDREGRLDQLRKRIDATIADQAVRRVKSRGIVKTIVAVAAVTVIAFGISNPFRWSWLESWSTSDEQQRVIERHTVTVDMVSKAIAMHEATGFFVVNNVEELNELLGFVTGIPAVIEDKWSAVNVFAHCFVDFIQVVVRYADVEGGTQSFTCTISYYADADFALFTFEQSREGESKMVGDRNFYISRNFDQTSVSWYDEATVIHISGSIDDEEAVSIMMEMIGG